MKRKGISAYGLGSRTIRLGFSLLCVLVILNSEWAHAQDATARILGVVTDAQGGVIPNATVNVTQVATNVKRTTLTDNEGHYEVLSLPIGTYQVTATATGFKTSQSQDITLQINQSGRVDLRLEVGGTSEVVIISDQAPLVETVNPTLGQSVTNRPLVDLPLNGRNVLQLALLQPGVSISNPDDTGAGAGAGSFGGISIAGNRSDSITFTIDGGLNNNLLSNGFVVTPNPDTIQEFRLLTSNYSAEWGRNAGGVINMSVKSGTNDFHGTVFEFLRNEKFNANTFFNKKDPVLVNGQLDQRPREILKRNQFGFTVGGPVLIPKVVQGKDRLFFFFGYQGQRQIRGLTTDAVRVFTPAEAMGDFSRSFRGGPDPGVADLLQRFPFFQSDPALQRQAVIDPNRINSVARRYFQNNLIPQSPTGFTRDSGRATDDQNEFTLKVDAVATQNDRIAVTLIRNVNPAEYPFFVTSNLTPNVYSNVAGYGMKAELRRYFANIGYTKIFSPTFLNEFRVTAQRQDTRQGIPLRTRPTAAELGIGTTPDNPTGPPNMSFASGLTIGNSTQGPTRLANNTFVFADTFTYTRGRHTMKYGASFSPFQNNTLYDFFINGRFTFSGPTRSGGIGSGNDFADFLFGLPNAYLQFGEAPSDIRTRSVYGFAQDEWRVLTNLTLTLGIRYEFSSPKKDTQGRSFSIIPGRQSQRFVNAPLGLVFPGDPGTPVGANFPDKNDWAPRFGFAWDPFKTGKTSVRGGFGAFYDILKGEDNLQFNGQAPFFGFSDLSFDPLSMNPTRDVNYFSDPYGATGIPNSFPSRPPARDLNFRTAGFLPFGGGGVYFVDPNLRTPYSFQYNLSVQQQLVSDLLFEISYVGSVSRKMTGLVDRNPMILGTRQRALNGSPSNAEFSYLDTFANVGNANYNSMQLSVQRRFADSPIGSTYFTLAYTYAHAIDTGSGFRNRGRSVPAYEPKRLRATSAFDITHRVVISGGWDLPFDRLWRSGPRRLTGGWSLFPIFSHQNGYPLDIFSGISRTRNRLGPSGAGDPNIVRPNLVSNGFPTTSPRQPQSFNGRTGNFWFDPSNVTSATLPSDADVQANPALRTYGTLPRNFFRGPGRTNVDITIAKMTNITERVKLEFRSELFNLFNTVQFQNPDTTITSSTFGQILRTYDPRIVQFALKFIF